MLAGFGGKWSHARRKGHLAVGELQDGRGVGRTCVRPSHSFTPSVDQRDKELKGVLCHVTVFVVCMLKLLGS